MLNHQPVEVSGQEQCCFYKAATVAYLLTALTCITIWIPWAATTEAVTQRMRKWMDMDGHDANLQPTSTLCLYNIKHHTIMANESCVYLHYH